MIRFTQSLLLTTDLCFRIRCDEDGWILEVNEEVPYPHFLHQYPLGNISQLTITGDIVVG